ncbi:mitochondrial carrier [Gonapodya prolifera JEL478]|uniref:Mitochondrial carrier n=1 Tax=Gonapodya prolifera (strain JEL478) TaxID=1344416 RepID=A0A138ZYQ9_GONPJ|nr:mitochondrial carrier [Gonapodya prolifera JEL478]|eukprot:KXS09639.1 mitochondrial carrier [Gonapodya prolifera JEL478]
MAPSFDSGPGDDGKGPIKKKPIQFSNLALGAALTVFEVSTLGQPFEVTKTHMAANRGDGFLTAARKTYARGGLLGFYQGLIPWAWIEASTKGAILLFTAAELEYYARATLGLSKGMAGIVAGMGGGIAQAYTTMGFCTFMKTVEVTRHKSPDQSVSTWKIAGDIFKREGIKGINKGVNAVAVRQMTNWGSRIGIARIVESFMLNARGEDQKGKPLSPYQRITASVLSGALSCWNQPIEVIRVEMQSQIKAVDRPEKLTIKTAARYIYGKNGFRGFYRGVTPRIGLGVWQTVCIVFGGDTIRAWMAERQKKEVA